MFNSASSLLFAYFKKRLLLATYVNHEMWSSSSSSSSSTENSTDLKVFVKSALISTTPWSRSQPGWPHSDRIQSVILGKWGMTNSCFCSFMSSSQKLIGKQRQHETILMLNQTRAKSPIISDSWNKAIPGVSRDVLDEKMESRHSFIHYARWPRKKSPMSITLQAPYLNQHESLFSSLQDNLILIMCQFEH